MVNPSSGPITLAKAILKSAALRSFEASGINRLAVRRNSAGMLVLGYHAILEEPRAQPFRYHHTAAEFGQHLEWLARHCEPVGLDGLQQWFNGDWNRPKPPAMVTFDDGYRNNASLAAEMLSRMGVPAVFFLATGYIGTENVLWPDDLFVRIVRWRGSQLRTPQGDSVPLPASAPAREALAFHILQTCKDGPERQRLDYLQYLREADPAATVKIYPEVQDFMSWEEVRSLSSRGFELGSHTVTHPILSRIDANQLQSELKQSRATVQAETGARCIAIAYPNGQRADYTPQVLGAVEEAGYQWGFTVSGRWNRKLMSANHAGRLTIDRIVPPGHVDSDTFSFHASGTRSLRGGN